MFYDESDKLLKESSSELSYGTATDKSLPEMITEDETENHILSLSAPGILEPSKDTPRPQNSSNQNIEDSSSPPINPWRTLITCSWPEAPFRSRSDNHSIDHTDEQVHERNDTCSIFISGYKNAAVKLRNSKFIYVFQFLFGFIQISALIMGILYNGKCSGTVALPAYGGLMGSIGTAITCFWIIMSYRNLHGRFSSDIFKIAFLTMFLIFSIFLLVEISVVGTMSPSFNQEASNYCDKTFYYFTFYKLIATGVAAILVLLLYLPGCTNYRCYCFATSGREEIED